MSRAPCQGLGHRRIHRTSVGIVGRLGCGGGILELVSMTVSVQVNVCVQVKPHMAFSIRNRRAHRPKGKTKAGFLTHLELWRNAEEQGLLLPPRALTARLDYPQRTSCFELTWLRP